MACKESVAIIGAGPAGCMCAYYALKHADVTLFEASSALHTLLYTGGGRCNLAYAEYDFKELAKFYPRGEKFLYSVFSRFGTSETINFFKEIGVETYTQDDLRVFPTSNSAKDVREKFLKSINRCKIIKEKVFNVEHCPSQAEGSKSLISGEGENARFIIKTNNNIYQFDKVVIAIGGHAGFDLAKKLGHTIVEPKPALTGLISAENFKSIQGVSLKDVEARIFYQDKKFAPSCDLKGDILFTHEGISGPLAYKISSICARAEYDKQNPLIIKLDLFCHAELTYAVAETKSKLTDTAFACEIISASIQCAHGEQILIHRSDTLPCNPRKLGNKRRGQVQDDNLGGAINFQDLLNSNSKKDIKNLVAEFVPKSLAEYILSVNGINLDEKCCNINGKTRDLILKSLQEFEVTVISPAKEGEVVTSGGVSLKEIDAKTMQSKLVNGLYFCGEVIDIDGFCGGFNLQNCWSTGFVAGINN